MRTALNRVVRRTGRLAGYAAALVLGFTALPKLAVAQMASGQTSFGFDILGGLAAPTGSLGDVTNSGYNIGVGLRITQPTSPVGFRLEAGYMEFPYNDGSGDTHRLISGTANLLYNLQGNGTTAGLYLIGGGGIYGAYDNSTGFYGPGYNSQTVTNAGLNGGLGYRLGLAGFSVFAEARYHYVFGTPQDSFIPITVGISF